MKKEDRELVTALKEKLDNELQKKAWEDERTIESITMSDTFFINLMRQIVMNSYLDIYYENNKMLIDKANNGKITYFGLKLKIVPLSEISLSTTKQVIEDKETKTVKKDYKELTHFLLNFITEEATQTNIIPSDQAPKIHIPLPDQNHKQNFKPNKNEKDKSK